MASGQIVAKDAFVTLETSNVARTVSGDVNTCTLAFNAETPESTGFGDTTRTRLPSGLKDWTLTFAGHFNDTATTGIETVLWGLLGAQTVMVFGPAGSTSGYVKYSGSGILQDYNVESPVEGKVNVSGTVVASAGSLTHATF
jgi:hypothetical protein